MLKPRFLQALRRFRRMCHEPYVPKISSASSASRMVVNEPAASYTSPFGEENTNNPIRPQTRAKSRTNPRTPYVQSAPQLTHNQAKRPRSRRKVSVAENDENPKSDPNTAGFQMFLSLPNTPDTEDPLRMLRTKPNVVPILGTQSYI